VTRHRPDAASSDSRGDQPVYRITGVRRGFAEEQSERTRRYLISMGVRTACFVGAVIATGWLRWVLVAGAVVLPYLAVVFANAGRERTEPPPPEVFLRPARLDLPPATPEPFSGP
jgi:hypothetical protein